MADAHVMSALGQVLDTSMKLVSLWLPATAREVFILLQRYRMQVQTAWRRKSGHDASYKNM